MDRIRTASARPRVVDGTRAGETLGRQTGFHALSQAVLACSPGQSLQRATEDGDEALFVVAGRGRLVVEDHAHQLAPETGAHLPPHQAYRVDGEDALTIVSVGIPGGSSERVVVSALADQDVHAATAAREFRIVADLAAATHFVGYIPPGRAPDHYHTYDEVIYVLAGQGALHADGARTPVARGSCIQLPARAVHCLENTGDDVMSVVAVFTPAGSPAQAYYPDGTPAYAPGNDKLKEEA